MTRQDLVKIKMGQLERAIYEATKKHGKVVKKVLISSMCYEWGSAPRYVKEMIKILVDLGKVEELEKGILKWKT